MSRANDVQGFVYDYPPNREQVFWNDVGYFPDGTGFHNAGNAIFREEKDLHKDGSALPASKYVNDVGYFPDGTAYNKAGNAIFAATLAPDPHTDGSPLPPSKYVNDIGYFPDGTAIDKAGNAINHS